MPELRRDPIVGRWVIIATERARRPIGSRALPAARAARRSARSARATRTRRRARSTSPAAPPSAPAERAGLEGARRAEPLPGAQDRGRPRPRGGGDLRPDERRSARTRSSSRRPTTTRRLKDLSDAELTEVLFAFKARILDLRNDLRFRYILLFKNHGQLAGASLEHAHSQLIALPVVPRQVVEEIEGARRHYELKERCIFCDIVGQERKDRSRLVHENDEFVVFAPCAPRSPFETWIVPKRHESNFEAEPKERLALCAQALGTTLRRLAAGARATPPTTSSSTRTRSATPSSPELPLAHRGHAGAHPGGRLRVGHRLPHQPGPARGGGRVPPQGRRASRRAPRRAETRWRSSSSPPRSRPGRRPAASATSPARCRGRSPRAATPSSVVTPRYGVDRPGGARASRGWSARARRARRADDALGEARGGARRGLLRRARALLRLARAASTARAARDYADNAERFAFLCRAALALPARARAAARASSTRTTGRPGSCPCLLRARARAATRPSPARARSSPSTTSPTRGSSRSRCVPALGLPWDVFRYEAMEFYDQLNFMKAGLVLRRRAHHRLARPTRARS